MLKIGYFTEEAKNITVGKLSAVRLYNEAKARGHQTYYFSTEDIFFKDGEVYAHANDMSFFPDQIERPQYKRGKEELLKLTDLDVLLVRKDPPLDQDYIMFSYILETLEKSKTLLINKPSAIRDSHSKLLTLQYPDFIPATLISRRVEDIKEFVFHHGKAIIKPINARAGQGVLILDKEDMNLNSLIDTMLQAYKKRVMIQEFIPEAMSVGDKRIIMFDGEPVAAILKRASAEDFRANIATGASFEKSELTKREQEICAALGPRFKQEGLFFVGVDIIGNYVTEINATSPGMLAPASKAYGIDFETLFWEKVEAKLASR